LWRVAEGGGQGIGYYKLFVSVSPPTSLRNLKTPTGRELKLFYCLNFGDHPDDVAESEVIASMIPLRGFDAVNNTLPKAAYMDLFLDGNLAVCVPRQETTGCHLLSESAIQT
jgi:hypothetical protein